MGAMAMGMISNLLDDHHRQRRGCKEVGEHGASSAVSLRRPDAWRRQLHDTADIEEDLQLDNVIQEGSRGEDNPDKGGKKTRELRGQ